MHKLSSIFFLLFLLFFVFTPKAFAAGLGGYQINNFDVDLEIQQDTSLKVTEKITVDFKEQRHGIFRIIPLAYFPQGEKRILSFDFLGVTDENGYPYKAEVKREPGPNVRIKIGDPDKTIIGEHTYVIKYNVQKILVSYPQHEEIFWNVTGSFWDVNIRGASAKVSSPYAKIIKIKCFAGWVGSKEESCQGNFEEKKANFTTNTALGPGKDFSIVLGLEKQNNLIYPTLTSQFLQKPGDYWGYPVAVIPFLIIFIKWLKKGRDRRYLKGNIYYEPEKKEETTVSIFERPHLPFVYHPIQGLTPAQAGTIVDELVHPKDLVAEILELARLGFIKIKKTELKRRLKIDEVDYAFFKQEKDISELKPHQEHLLDSLFDAPLVRKSTASISKVFKSDPEGMKEAIEAASKDRFVLLSALKQKFATPFSQFQKKIYKDLTDQGLFDGNPNDVREKWIGIFILLAASSLYLSINYAETFDDWRPAVIAIVFAIPGIFLAKNMPRKTAKGYSLHRQCAGLTEYLKYGKWRTDIAEKHLFIEEILPLAVALGVAKSLAKQMQDLGLSPPQYFPGATASSFSSDLSGFQSQGAISLSTSSSGSGFGGGGGAGGGGGGGGGGSW